MAARLLLLCVLMLFVSPILLAQGGPEPVDSTTSPLEWYTSLSGVALATTFGVSMLKRLLGNVNGLNQIPTWVYAGLVGAALTSFAAFVLETLPGEPIQLIWQSIFNATSASGIYEWVHHSNDTLKQSAHKQRVAG